MTSIHRIVLSLLLIPTLAYAQLKYANDTIKTGAEQTALYIDKLKGKRVALVANQTSIIGSSHLLDSLLNRGVAVVKVFGPEHGFRGNASNGTVVADEVDPSTGVRIKLVKSGKLNLSWMIELYTKFPDKARFFDRGIHPQIGNIDYLAGVTAFKRQLASGTAEAEIRKT